MSTVDATGTASGTPFRVLHVCTGNICRSPIAERLMRQGLAERVGPSADEVLAESAGTAGLVGRGMDPGSMSVLASYGIDGAGFRSRALAAEQVVAADLVLTATREHRAAAVRLQPRAAARTFTLREFDRLTASVDPSSLRGSSLVERGRALVRAASAQRGRVPASAHEDDIEDPYRGPSSGFVMSAELIFRSLQRPLDLLAGTAVETRV